MQYVIHPDTGEPLLDEKTIIGGLNHKSIKKYAYILHDKDVWLEEDAEKNANHEEGKKKPAHWHVVVSCENAVELGSIAKWFNVPEQYIDVPKGQGALLDCVEYLTHSSEKAILSGKHRYDDGEVKASEGWDWRKGIEQRKERRAKYGKDLSAKQELRAKVLYEGMTLREVQKKYPVEYMDDCDKLNKFRILNIQNSEPPKLRINYYIYGKGGVGKDLISRALARSLFPNIENDDDLFFVVGAGQVSFDGYDGQPVLIWSDRRAGQMLKVCGGRENFFNIFDSHPTKQRQNIKYGSLNLANCVNIVNGQESYITFINALSGEYKDREGTEHKAEDKGQTQRRFPFIIPLREKDFDLLINRGFVENDNTKFDEYFVYKNLCGNASKLVKLCGGENETFDKASKKMLEVVTDEYQEVITKQEESEDEIKLQEYLEEISRQNPEKKKLKEVNEEKEKEKGYEQIKMVLTVEEQITRENLRTKKEEEKYLAGMIDRAERENDEVKYDTLMRKLERCRKEVKELSDEMGADEAKKIDVRR